MTFSTPSLSYLADLSVFLSLSNLAVALVSTIVSGKLDFGAFSKLAALSPILVSPSIAFSAFFETSSHFPFPYFSKIFLTALFKFLVLSSNLVLASSCSALLASSEVFSI